MFGISAAIAASCGSSGDSDSKSSAHGGKSTGGKSTGGKREYLETLARAAMAAGADGLFMECHPRPSEACSDGPNAFYLEHVGTFVRQLLAIRELVQSQPKLLPEARADARPGGKA